METLLTKYKEIQQQEHGENTIKLSGTRDELNGFHLQTRYPEFLNKRDISKLKDLFTLNLSQESPLNAQLGIDSEDQSLFITACIQFLFIRAEAIIQLTPRHVRCLLNSFDREHTSIRPFKPLQEKPSLWKYARTLKAFIIFLLQSFKYQHPNPIRSNPRIKSIEKLYQLSQQAKDDLQELQGLLQKVQIKDDRGAQQGRTHSANPHAGDLSSDSEEDFDLNSDDEDGLDSQTLFDSLHKPIEKAKEHLKQFKFEYDQVIEGCQLIQSLLIHLATSRTNITHSGPIYGFFACSSVNFHQKSFKGVNLISQAYSAFIYGMQLVVLDYFWVDWCGYLLEHDGDSIVDESPLVDHIKPWLIKYFRHQSEYPLGELLSFRAYALHYNSLASTLGNEVYEIGPHHLQFHQVQVKQKQLQRFFQRSIQNLSQLLIEKLLLNQNLELFAQITLKKAAEFEDFLITNNCFNFLTQNTDYKAYQDSLVKKILGDGELFSKWFLVEDNDIQLVPFQAEAYLNQVKKFQLHLLFLIHMTSGAPARGTEIIPIQSTNTIIKKRNIFLDPKTHLFLIRLSYSKTFSMTGSERNAVRALPQSLSHVLLIYMVVVEPFIHYIHEALHITNRRAYLFSIRGELPTSRQLSARMGQETQLFLHHSINLHAWRHISQGFIRYGMGEVLQDDSIEASELSEVTNEALAAGQAHHSAKTAMLIYGRPKVQFSNLALNQQAAFIDFSQRWHHYIGLSPDFNLLGHLFQPVSLDRSSPDETADEDQEDTLFTLNAPCLRASFENPKTTPPASHIPIGQFNQFFSTTSPIFNPVQPQMESNVDPHAELDPDPYQQVYKSARNKVIFQPYCDLLLHLFQEFLGDQSASFKSPEQRQVLYHLLAKQPYLVAVLPTAGGKTTLFLLGASLAWSKTTILVVPLIALKLNLQKKLEALGISFAIWEEKGSDTPTCNLVLVSIESVKKKNFLEWAQSLVNQGGLDRVIWDEAHLIPLAHSYRNVMDHVKKLIKLPVQHVFASATMTNEALSELKKMMRLPSSVPLVVRGDISRPEIHYNVNDIPAGIQSDTDVFDFLLEFIKDARMSNKIAMNAQVIIYLPSRNMVETFYDQHPTQVTYYHGKMSKQIQASQLDSFITKKKLILVGTTGIGEGYDFHHVSMVIHWGTWWEMSQFLQGSGRAARGTGSIGWSFIFRNPRKPLPQPQNGEEQVFHQYLQEQICRRRPINLNFNEKVIEACSENDQLCDLCTQRQNQLVLVSHQAIQAETKGSKQRERLMKYIQYWHSKGCLNCALQDLGKFYSNLFFYFSY